MQKSIITNDMNHCFVPTCRSSHVVTHHCLHGWANRSLADKYGLFVPLCGFHHNQSSEGVHFNRAFDEYLEQLAEEKFKEHYPDLDFVETFGKNF